MIRRPFKMLPSRSATARGGGRPLTGRASFVWLHGVLMPIACGITDTVEIRRAERNSPWHVVRGDAQEAYDELMAGYPLQRASLKRIVAYHRQRRGLAPLNREE